MTDLSALERRLRQLAHDVALNPYAEAVWGETADLAVDALRDVAAERDNMARALQAQNERVVVLEAERDYETSLHIDVTEELIETKIDRDRALDEIDRLRAELDAAEKREHELMQKLAEAKHFQVVDFNAGYCNGGLDAKAGKFDEKTAHENYVKAFMGDAIAPKNAAREGKSHD